MCHALHLTYYRSICIPALTSTPFLCIWWECAPQNRLEYCLFSFPQAKKFLIAHFVSLKHSKIPIKWKYHINESGSFWPYSNDSPKQHYQRASNLCATFKYRTFVPLLIWLLSYKKWLCLFGLKNNNIVTISLGAYSVLWQPLVGALLPPHLHPLGTPPLRTDPGWPYPFISVAPDLAFALLQSACQSPSSPIHPFPGNSLGVDPVPTPSSHLLPLPSHFLSVIHQLAEALSPKAQTATTFA